MERRDLLQAIITAGGVGIAGCGGRAVSAPETEQTPAQTTTRSSKKTPTESPTPTPTETETPHPALTREWNWEYSGDCSNSSMPHDYVIKVKSAVTEISKQYEPVQFIDLTAGEKEILQTVITKGGYGTCEVDPSDPFDKFLTRVSKEYVRQREDFDPGEENQLYLKNGTIFYRLRVREQDTVIFG
jgi:hypothetical protein